MPTRLPRGIIRFRDQYRVRITIDGRRVLVGDYGSLADAKSALALAKADMVRGTYRTPAQRRAEARAEAERMAAEEAAASAEAERRTTVTEWSETWLRLLEEHGRADGTLRSYRSVLRVHLLPALGALPLGEVGQAHIDPLMRGKSAAMRQRIIICLHSMYAAAVEAGAGGLESIPFRLPSAKTYAASSGALDADKVASPQQVRALAEAMPERYRLAVLLAATCSLRMGEVLGLQRRDIEGIDTGGGVYVHVRRQWNPKAIGGAAYTPPKAGSAGVVALPSQLVDEVRAHLDMWVGEEAKAPLFASPRDAGHPVAQSALDRYWRAARERAGMSGFRFHDLRHTGLTMYAQQGATVAEIMARGRHRHPDVAVRYQHATRERDRANADALGRAFGSPDALIGDDKQAVRG